jgi:predicted cupin superfamily sugar epimerase
VTSVEVIRLFGLKPLESEGGWFRETWRGTGGTAIYYLLTSDTCSRLHRLAQDEVWHFYLGSPVTMLLLHPDGRAERVVLGPDIERGQELQVAVPAGTWQGAYVEESTIDECRVSNAGDRRRAGRHDVKCEMSDVKRSDTEGEWRVAGGEQWALMGTTAAPPFDRAGFEAGVRAALLRQYPAEREAIVRLTRVESTLRGPGDPIREEP